MPWLIGVAILAIGVIVVLLVGRSQATGMASPTVPYTIESSAQAIALNPTATVSATNTVTPTFVPPTNTVDINALA
jgi:hypothetical protein